MSTAAAAIFVGVEKRRPVARLSLAGDVWMGLAMSATYTPRALAALSLLALCVTVLTYSAYASTSMH